ncbi:pyridoxine 5'-phosphate synthase [Bacteroidia bacterium]|nr:pyridoxine 5'-phosphate synthase [Bacteroidia bacterium]MDA9214154.1 pyridoxine 5'-phosphate synthase [Bacteroidia bacterium]
MGRHTKLSVNVNKFATIRNARGGNNPDLVQVAKDCEAFGAEGITVHPRPDERHVRKADVYALKEIVTTEFNIEGYPSPEFISLIHNIKPEQVTLVPDPPDALTSNAGWDTIKYEDYLKSIIEDLKKSAGRVSIFLEANPDLLSTAKSTGADRIELYTEPYAIQYASDKTSAISPFKETAKLAGELGLGINAGHDLSLENLNFLTSQLPELQEVSIGHALVCDALYHGLQNTIQMYLSELDTMPR